MLIVLVMTLAAAARPQSQDAFAAYRARVDAYRSGTVLNDRDLDALPPSELPRLVERAVDPASGWTPIDLTSAAMLHTDVCLRFVKIRRPVDARDQIDAAAALLRAAAARDGTRLEFARRWRDTVSSLLEAYGAADLAKDLGARGHEWWPQSKEETAAQNAFAQGLTHEIQAAVAGRLSGPPPTRPFATPPDAISALRHAAEDHAAAVASDAANTEAALHLGRVLLLLGRDGDAVPRLRSAASSANPAIRYLAFMFLGAVDERAGRLDAAVEEYRRAGDAFHWGQSAPLALSHALMRVDRDADARQALTDHFASTGRRVCEPLWTYLADPSTDLGPTLDELRAEIWR